MECPKELLDLPEIWPQVDGLDGPLLDQIKTYGLNGPWSKYCCVKFLQRLRRSFLQDLPGLIKSFPHHPTWSAVPNLFRHPEFIKFQEVMDAHVKASHKAGAAPDLEQVRNCVQSLLTLTRVLSSKCVECELDCSVLYLVTTGSGKSHRVIIWNGTGQYDTIELAHNGNRTGTYKQIIFRMKHLPSLII